MSRNIETLMYQGMHGKKNVIYDNTSCLKNFKLMRSINKLFNIFFLSIILEFY